MLNASWLTGVGFIRRFLGSCGDDNRIYLTRAHCSITLEIMHQGPSSTIVHSGKDLAGGLVEAAVD